MTHVLLLTWITVEAPHAMAARLRDGPNSEPARMYMGDLLLTFCRYGYRVCDEVCDRSVLELDWT